jgi:hypothetical protein
MKKIYRIFSMSGQQKNKQIGFELKPFTSIDVVSLND